MSEGYQWVQQFLAENQFASGGLLLGLITAIGIYLRNLPGQLYGLAKRQLVLTVEILDEDPIYGWISKWLAHHPYSARSRRLTAISRFRYWVQDGPIDGGSNEKKPLPSVQFAPAPGLHFFAWRGRHFLLTKSRDESAASGDGSGGIGSLWNQLFRRESMTLQTMRWNRRALGELLEDARKLAEVSPPDALQLFHGMSHGSWQETRHVARRAAQSVILPDGLAERLIEDIATFQRSQQWYNDRGVPWRRGYLLHGPPGNGKTSLIRAVASELQLDIGVIHLSASLGDAALIELLNNAEPRMLVVFEDVDCLFVDREVKDSRNHYVTFSGMLNAMDGVGSCDGRIIFMTTNHRDRLNSALIRPGRIDWQIPIGMPSVSQAQRFYQRFFHDTDMEAVQRFSWTAVRGGYSMAELQEHLLQHRDDWIEASRLPERESPERESIELQETLA